MRRPGTGGFTLLEVTVSFALLLLATAMMMALFVPSMSLFRRQTGKSDVYRGCLMLMEKFQVGTLNSQLETMTISSNNQAMCWQLTNETIPFSSATGEPLLTPDFAIIYYEPNDKRVYYKEYRASGLPSGNQPGFLSRPELDLACSSNSSATRVLAREVVEFELSDKDGDTSIIEPPLTLRVTCEVNTKGTETNDVETFTLESKATPRSRRW